MTLFPARFWALDALLEAEPAAAPLVPTEVDAEYARLSKRLGINEIPLQLVELERVLQAERIAVYDYGEVTTFLDGQVTRRRKALEKARRSTWRAEWNWHPVKDYSAWKFGDGFSHEIYNQPIPPSVVHIMSPILEQFPDAQFYVSHSCELRDPFLAVSVPGADRLYVIERWRQPGFQD